MVKVPRRRISKKRGFEREAALVRFIEYLARYGGVSYACRKAGITQQAVVNQRRNDVPFSQAWDDAVDYAADFLELCLYKRAEIDDTPAGIFLLKGMRPDKYRERRQVTTVEEKSIDDAIEAEFTMIKLENETPKLTGPPGQNGQNGNGNGKEK